MAKRNPRQGILSGVTHWSDWQRGDAGLYASLLVPEVSDVPLQERCDRVNRVCSELGRRNVCLVSIHVNAAGRGDKWMNIFSRTQRPTATSC